MSLPCTDWWLGGGSWRCLTPTLTQAPRRWEGSTISFVADAFNSLTGKTAADAAKQGAQTAADAQMAGLDYLKETEELPQQFRQEGLTKLGGLYGLEGGEGSQQELIDYAEASPLHAAIMGTQSAGEEAIMRNAAATGGLRSGNVQENLYDYNQRLKERALLSSYDQQLTGLEGLAGLPSAARDIAAGTAGVGETEGMGEVAAGQAKQDAYGNLLNAGISIAGLI